MLIKLTRVCYLLILLLHVCRLLTWMSAPLVYHRFDLCFLPLSYWCTLLLLRAAGKFPQNLLT